MKAHEALNSDDQAVADNAAEILRTMARIVDDMRHLQTLAPTMDDQHSLPSFRGQWFLSQFPSLIAWWQEESGGAPVEDWLDHQWAEASHGLDFRAWTQGTKDRLLAAVFETGDVCPVCNGGPTDHEPGCSLAASLRARPWHKVKP
jgi:hypothetical protein